MSLDHRWKPNEIQNKRGDYIYEEGGGIYCLINKAAFIFQKYDVTVKISPGDVFFETETL